MVRTISGKNLFFASVAIAAYFFLLFLNAYTIQFIDDLMVTFVELLTIPLLIIQLVLMVVAFAYCRKNHFKITSYTFWAFLILLISNVITLGSFI